MASRKRVKKKRLKEDQLVTFTVRASQFIQQYLTHVIVGVVVLVVAVAAIVLTAHMRRSAARASEQEFALAMSQYNGRDVQTAATSFARIASKYGSYNAGELSRYFLGKALLDQGKYDEAMSAFDQYIAKAGQDSPFKEAATIGKAMCMEGMHNFMGAAGLLEQLSLAMDPKDPRCLDVTYQAGYDYEKAGSRDKAVELYQKVSDKATGQLKDRASVSIALLQ